MRKNKAVELSAYEQLNKYFSELEVIINPNFLTAFKRQLYACYEENKKEAYAAAKISDEALAVEKLLKEYRETVKRHGFQLNGIFRKALYKNLLKLVDEADKNINDEGWKSIFKTKKTKVKIA